MAHDNGMRAERTLAITEQITHIGSWEWRPGQSTVRWSDELYRIYGYEPQSRTVTPEFFLSHVHPDAAVREKSSDYMGLMTPVLKGYLTDKGFQVCSNAVQVHGGSGFTEHFPVSQFMRDCRIALIYEGTNGVQALDLVGGGIPRRQQENR